MDMRQAAKTSGSIAWWATKTFALLGRRYGGMAGLLFGAIFALPILLFIVALFFLIFFQIVYAILGGEAVGILMLVFFLGGITLAVLGLYHFITRRIKAAYLADYLPFLNEYQTLLSCYDPDQLNTDLKPEIKQRVDTLTHILETSTPAYIFADLNLNPDNPRDLLRHIPFTPEHFAPYSLNQIRVTFPEPIDTSALEQQLNHSFLSAARRRGDTLIGEQHRTTPALQHTRPDAFIAIPDAVRFRHSYVIGKTGSGKSVLLQHLIVQDLENSQRGVIVLSPEDGIFQKLLGYIPESRHDDLIYFDPTSTAPPIVGINPFDFSEADNLAPLAREELLTQRAGELYTIFERALGELGVKMVTLIQNVAFALLSLPNTSILDIDRLLHPRNQDLRDRVRDSPSVDTRTRAFWTDYDGVNANYYKSAYTTVVNRLEPFFRPPLSLTFTTPSISFANILNNERPRIVFLNVSRLRGVQAQIAGQLLIAEIQQALQRREQIPENNRQPYYFYVDEFALFATSEKAFIDLFARARKYRMACCVAHQTASDIPASFLDVLIGNVATIAAMQLSAGDAPYFAKELQLIEANETRRRQITEREAARIDTEARRMYRETGRDVDPLADPYERLRLQHKIQDYAGGSLSPALLQNLPVGKAIVKTVGYNYGTPISVPFLKDRECDADALILRSKQNYGRARALVPSPVSAPVLAINSTSTTAEEEVEIELC